MTAETRWRNRIVGHGDEDPRALKANPRNWRRHPQAQREALSGALDEVGWVADVLINCTTGNMIDGHARVELALERNEPSVPVRYVELSEEEERLVLATLDPTTAMAETDQAALDALLAETRSADGRVQQMLDALKSKQDSEGANDTGPSNAVFTEDQIIDAAFAYFRATGFPYRNLPVHVCMQEINKLAQTESENLLHTSMAYHVADTYHPHRFHAAAERQRSPVDAFANDALLRRALRLQYAQGGNNLSQGYFPTLTLVAGTQACSNFRPGFALLLYRRFCKAGDTVLDTSTGYGGRLVGFMASGCARYISIDPNKPTHEGNSRLAADLGFAERVELHNLPAEDVPHDVVAGRCNFAFTSPPYFAKEHYAEDDTQSWVRYKTGEEWRQGFLLPMFALQFGALKPGCHAVVNIADVKLRGKTYPLVQWANDAARQAGFDYVRTDEYTLTRRFGAGQDDEVATEAAIVFRKPDLPA